MQYYHPYFTEIPEISDWAANEPFYLTAQAAAYNPQLNHATVCTPDNYRPGHHCSPRRHCHPQRHHSYCTPRRRPHDCHYDYYHDCHHDYWHGCYPSKCHHKHCPPRRHGHCDHGCSPHRCCFPRTGCVPSPGCYPVQPCFPAQPCFPGYQIGDTGVAPR